MEVPGERRDGAGRLLEDKGGQAAPDVERQGSKAHRLTGLFEERDATLFD